MAFLVINYNQKKEQKIKNRPKNPLYDLNKDMPGSKAGDDCQWVNLQREHLTF